MATRAGVKPKALVERDRAWAKRYPAKAAQEAAIIDADRKAKAKFGRKAHGTYQTHSHASKVKQGALARLYEAGSISIDQLVAGVSISHIYDRITSDVIVATMSMETRVDQSRAFDGTFYEKLGTVRAEVAYSRWRKEMKQSALVLAIIINDLSLSEAARQYRVRKARVKPLLIEALDLWDKMNRSAVDDVDEDTLIAAQAGLLG